MKTENEDPDVFEDFIQDNEAPYTLRSSNAKMQTGVSFRKTLCKYNSRSENTEPHHPQQNPAESIGISWLDYTTSDERLGHWLGVAENKGDLLTYLILTENKQ
eukprot:7317980-Ditylum_brightwellii.AAC.1